MYISQYKDIAMSMKIYGIPGIILAQGILESEQEEGFMH
jgi:hypothetical protein